jgi:putative ABC transport system permease protein
MRLDHLRQDLLFAIRSLAKRPGFAVVVIATIALGVGASTAIFSIVEGILLRPLPFPEPDRLAFVSETAPVADPRQGGRGPRMSFAWPNFLDFRDRARSFESISCYQGNAFTVLDVGTPRRLDGRLVCANFFEVLRVPLQLGRTFRPEDDRVGASPVAIVSDRFWRNELGSDAQVLGRTLRMNDITFTIVGVLPQDFQFLRRDDIYAPVGLTVTEASGWLDRGNHSGLNAVARLAPGVPLEQADAEAERIGADLARAYPNTNSGNSARVVMLRDRIVVDVEDTLVALMGAVGFLLLLACVNVSNLLVARGASRQHELAIRTALGGSRWRIVRGLLAESAVLSAVGGLAAVFLAAALLRAIVAIAPADIPRLDGVALNRMSLLFAVAAAAVCGLVFGSFPAIQASGARGHQLLARASRTSAAVSPHRTRRVLMVVEVALAIVLLVGCGLMARTMAGLSAVDPGFQTENLLTARVVLAGTSWDSVDRRRTFYEQTLQRLRQIPGVTAAALTLSLPIEGSNWGSIFTVRDKPVPPRAQLPAAAFVPVSAGYLETVGMRLLKGRTFDSRDAATAPHVVIVNETLAKRLWPGEDAVGKQLKQGWPETPERDAPWREVVGVVGDVKLEGVDQDTPLQAYLPLTQAPSRSIALVVRTAVEPLQVRSALEAAVQAFDRDLPVIRVTTMEQLMVTAIARQRLSTLILAVFAGVAILVAAVGLYGVMSHSVTERTREIGVRMALGARGGQVLRLFIMHGLTTALIGTVLGVAGALWLSRALETLLFGVEPTDPITLVAVVVVLLGVATLACYVPARRASRTDPLVALRTE